MKYYCPNTGKHIPFNLIKRKTLERIDISETVTFAKQCYVVRNCPYCGEEHEFEISPDYDNYYNTL